MSTKTSTSTRRVWALVMCAAVLGTLVCTAVYAWTHGYRLYVVETDSMSPAFRAGDLVVDRPASTGYQPGDVLTVQISAAGDLVTHRMTRQDKQGRVHTKGDANKTPDAWALKQDQVRGVVKHSLPNLGYVVVFMRQPEGVAGLMTSALSLYLLWGLCFPAARERRVTATDPEPVDEAAPLVPRQRLAVVPVPGAPALLPPLPPPDRGVPVTASLHMGSEKGTPQHIPAPRDPSA